MHLRLDMTLRELIERLTENDNADNIAGWVNIRRTDFPWQQMVDDAERGLAEVSRAGRKLMARQDEIDRWLTARKIPLKPVAKAPPADAPHDPNQAALALMIRESGFRKR